MGLQALPWVVWVLLSQPAPGPTCSGIYHCFTNKEYCLRSQEDTAPEDCHPWVGLGGLKCGVPGAQRSAWDGECLSSSPAEGDPAPLPLCISAVCILSSQSLCPPCTSRNTSLSHLGSCTAMRGSDLPGGGFSILLGVLWSDFAKLRGKRGW